MHVDSTVVFAGVAFLAIVAGELSAQRAPQRVNPLLQASPLPYGVPAFDRIRSDDFRAAFDQGMREELADVDRIANSTEPPVPVIFRHLPSSSTNTPDVRVPIHIRPSAVC